MVQVLKDVPHFASTWAGRTGPLDDAALLNTPGGQMVYTLDVITPIVDDPRSFGRIAAANALSDVYAMGAAPMVALSFVGMPESLGLDSLKEVIHGAAEKALEAQCAIVGGHTIKDSEPKCGLAVIGHLSEKAWTHEHAEAGQSIVITKKLGTGILGQAFKNSKLSAEQFRRAQMSMEMLNKDAALMGRKHGASSATDVTGFGFLGHLHHMAAASGLVAQIDVAKVPFFEGVREAAEAGLVPGGSKKNWLYVSEFVDAGGLDDLQKWMLADAQTSGGLLLSLPTANVAALLEELPGSVAIGTFNKPAAGSTKTISLR